MNARLLHFRVSRTDVYDRPVAKGVGLPRDMDHYPGAPSTAFIAIAITIEGRIVPHRELGVLTADTPKV